MKALFQKWRQRILERLRRRVSETELLEDLTFSMLQMLRVPLKEAERLARVAAAHRAKLDQLVKSGEPDRALNAFRRMPQPLDLAQVAKELEPHSAGSYLLALPLSVSSVALLAHLVQEAHRQFCIINTSFTRFYFHPFLAGQTRARVRLLTSAEMIGHHREHNERPDASAVTYVTFPDHQTSRRETMWRFPFLGEDYEFSTLEPVLFYRGLRPLFTFDARNFASTGRLRLSAYQEAVVSNKVAESDVRALLAWLVQHIETVFRENPTDVLAWDETQMHASRMRARVLVVKLKLVEGYLRAWKAADPNFQAETHARAIAELGKLQESANAPEKAYAAALR